ncbi:MAG: hypothetical protein HQL76_09485 [Magnetococcales bacterium]|nr:hypothetical protein [Magnetococcales bacterium]
MTRQNESSDLPVPCLRCRHFQVTWEPQHPRSCRIMGFKTRDWPCFEVRRSSGESCLAFEERAIHSDDKKDPSPPSKSQEGPKRFSRIA